MAGQEKKGSLKAPVEKEDKLDLNLSPPCFLTPVSNDETQELLLSILKRMMTACQSILIKILVT